MRTGTFTHNQIIRRHRDSGHLLKEQFANQNSSFAYSLMEQDHTVVLSEVWHNSFTHNQMIHRHRDSDNLLREQFANWNYYFAYSLMEQDHRVLLSEVWHRSFSHYRMVLRHRDNVIHLKNSLLIKFPLLHTRLWNKIIGYH